MYPGRNFGSNFSTITADRRKKTQNRKTAGISRKNRGGYRRFLEI